MSEHLEQDLFDFVASSDSLSAQQRQLYQAHLEVCPQCRQAVQDTEIVLQGMEKIAAPVAPATMDSALFARIRSIEANSTRTWFSLARFREFFDRPEFYVSTASAAAACAVVMLVATPAEDLEQTLFDDAAVHRQVIQKSGGLALYEELDLFENLDVLDDLAVIESLDDEGA